MTLGPAVLQISDEWASQTASAGILSLAVQDIKLQVTFEPDHLRRLLVNLLDNARRYATGETGSIQLALTTDTQQHAILSVWSNGPPLEPSVEQHLFEPFFSSESRSTGLGLFICRELCEGHGASIFYQRAQRNMGQREVAGNMFAVTFRTARGSASNPDAQ